MKKDISVLRCISHMFPGILLLAFTLLLPCGCRSRQPVFPTVSDPVTWPAGSPEPRLRYVGKLEQASDLKPHKSWLGALAEFIWGGSPPSPLYGPRGIIVIENRVWVADPGGRCIHLFNLESREYKKLTVLRIGDNSTVRTFSSPVGLCRGPGDTFFVCDSESSDIYQFDNTGGLVRHLPVDNDVDRPTALCYIDELKQLYIVDTKNHNIKVYHLDGALVKILGTRGTLSGEFNFPLDIKYDGEWLWVVDSCNGRVQAITLDGKPMRTIGRFGNRPGDFALPKSIAIDSKKNIYVVDSRFENIQVFNREGQLLIHFGSEGKGPGEFSLPSGIFIDEYDKIWICDSYNRRLQLIEPYRKEDKKNEY